MRNNINQEIGWSMGISLLMLASVLLTGCMSIHTAARQGKVEVVKRQLALGVSPNNNWSRYANTPLIKAAESGRIKVVELLLEKGADVNKHNEGGETPLHYATKHGHAEVMKILLEHGADVTAKGTGCGTPLQWAARSGQIKAAEILLAYGADINAGRGSPLQDAVRYEQSEMVRYLLARGADINAGSDRGSKLLHTAALSDDVEIRRILLEHGAVEGRE